jgi:hypothetical protein
MISAWMIFAIFVQILAEIGWCGAHDTSLTTNELHEIVKVDTNLLEWSSIQISISDSDLAHFRKRATEVMNDAAVWQHFGEKYEGPYKVASTNFEYEFVRLVRYRTTIAVIVPITKKLGWHSMFVKVTFRQYFRDDKDKEVAAIELNAWP